MTRLRLPLAAALVAATSIAWLDPHHAVREANKLYAEGKYEDATAAYNAALVDRPDSADLHFNLGDSIYKQGKYEDAIAAFSKVETANDAATASRVAYNVGNATFRNGQALEQTEPQKALELYATALASYRRALGLTPSDEDSKFNHELVTQRIAELKKRLEEQKKEQQDQKQDQQQGDEQKQDQQKQDEQQQDQAKDQQQPEQGEQPPQDEQQKDEQQQQQAGDDQQQPPEDQQKQEQQQAGGEQPEDQQPKPDQQRQQQGEQSPDEPQDGEPQPGGEAVAGEKQDGELSKGEAAAILDSQRGEEVSPEDVIRKLQGARVAEPAEDW